MDTTQLTTFQQCPRRYQYRFLEGLVKQQEDVYGTPLQFGSAIHAGLAELYRRPTTESNAHGVAFLRAYPSAPPNETLRTPEHGQILLDAYRKHYAEQDKAWKVVSVEEVGEMAVGGLPFQVKCDLIVETDAGFWAVEHKTTQKSLTELYWRSFEPNGQLTAQTRFVLQKYGQCSGVIVNALSFGIRQRAYKGEPAGFHYTFQRQIFNRNALQIREWENCTAEWIAKLDYAKSAQAYPMNETACTYCTYRELCISANDEQVKETLYTKVDPYAYLTEGVKSDG